MAVYVRRIGAASSDEPDKVEIADIPTIKEFKEVLKTYKLGSCFRLRVSDQ
jgi:hypothetical protein